MVESRKGKVNAFAPLAAPGEEGLAARVQSLTCLLQLGRLIEGENRLENVCSQLPDILVDGLDRNRMLSVQIILGDFAFRSSGFAVSANRVRKEVRCDQERIGELQVNLEPGLRLSAEQEDLLVAVCERLGRFYERKNLQSALERSEQRYQRLFRQARDGILLVDSESGMVLDANDSFLDLLGMTLDGLRTRKVWELVAVERRDQFQAEFERLALEQERQWLSLPVVASSGRMLELEVSCSMIHFSDHPVIQFICRDITERLMLTRRLGQSENRYRAIFDSAPVAMILCDGNGTILDVNSYLLSQFFHDQVGKRELTRFHVTQLGVFELGDRRRDFMRFLEGVCVQLPEVPIPESSYRAAGYANIRCIPLTDDRNIVVGGVIIVEDISEVREAQRAMMQSAKMAAVGQMTSGFAHEIGTPLGTISANAQYLIQELGDGKGNEELQVILSETNRITNLIQQLLIFSRPAKFDRAATSVNELIHQVLTLMKSQRIMRDVAVVTDLADDAPPLLLEPTLIKQVFFNLVINACQAMPNGGQLTIRTRVLGPKGRPAGAPRQVEITFRDTGVGISEGDLRKIFTPFFTTKDVGKGTGLGLSVSYRIVQNHGGAMAAESEGEGKGALFRVSFPVTGTLQDEAPQPTHVGAPAGAQGEGEDEKG